MSTVTMTPVERPAPTELSPPGGVTPRVLFAVSIDGEDPGYIASGVTYSLMALLGTPQGQDLWDFVEKEAPPRIRAAIEDGEFEALIPEDAETRILDLDEHIGDEVIKSWRGRRQPDIPSQ